MGRRKGNCLEQRAQRTQQRAQIVAAQAAQDAQAVVEAEAKASSLQAVEREKTELRKARLTEDFQNGKGFVFRSQKEWGGVIHAKECWLPFVYVEYFSFPNGTSYYQAKSLDKSIQVANVYSKGVDLGIHFFNKDLVEVLVSS